MATIREQILAAMVTALNTGTPVGVPQTERTRRLAVQGTATTNSIVLRPTRSTTEEIGSPNSPITRARMTVEVEMQMAGTVADRPDKLIDPLYEWIVKALVNNRLGGLCHGIDEGESSFQYGAEGQYPNVMLTVEMSVPFSYLAADPTSKT